MRPHLSVGGASLRHAELATVVCLLVDSGMASGLDRTETGLLGISLRGLPQTRLVLLTLVCGWVGGWVLTRSNSERVCPGRLESATDNGSHVPVDMTPPGPAPVCRAKKKTIGSRTAVGGGGGYTEKQHTNIQK